MKEHLPQNILKFCPRCASSSFQFKADHSFTCQDCKFHFFINAAGAVACIIKNEGGQILLTKRAHEPFKGSYDLPGGFIDPHESAEDAISREIKEELNLTITKHQFLKSFPNQYKFGGMIYYTVDMAFICNVESLDSIQVNDDVCGYKFRSPNEINLNKIGFESIRNIILHLQKTEKE